MTETYGGEPGTSQSWGRASGPRAGFWRRLGGAVIDGVIVGVVGSILELLLKHGIGDVLALIVSASYFTYFEGGPKGAGFGKQAMGIRVIDAHTGLPIGHPRAFVRWIGQYLSAIVIFLGYFWMLWDREKQCWHDKLAGDVVVPTADYPVVQPAGA
jgi:uncharacterized RDD family membrane protein YckC